MNMNIKPISRKWLADNIRECQLYDELPKSTKDIVNNLIYYIERETEISCDGIARYIWLMGNDQKSYAKKENMLLKSSQKINDNTLYEVHCAVTDIKAFILQILNAKAAWIYVNEMTFVNSSPTTVILYPCIIEKFMDRGDISSDDVVKMLNSIEGVEKDNDGIYDTLLTIESMHKRNKKLDGFGKYSTGTEYIF
jgi:hypothetical protein